MIQKDFDAWNQHKKLLHALNPPFFKEGQIWWCGLGCNIGYEQDGKGDSFLRPVLILRKFNRYLFMGVPLSTKIKENLYYYHFTFKGKQQAAILSQTKPLDSRRLYKRIGELNNDEDFKAIKHKMVDIMFKN